MDNLEKPEQDQVNENIINLTKISAVNRGKCRTIS